MISLAISCLPLNKSRRIQKERQARHFMKHTKHLSTPSSKSAQARQVREQVKHASTQARHLADSQKCGLRELSRK